MMERLTAAREESNCLKRSSGGSDREPLAHAAGGRDRLDRARGAQLPGAPAGGGRRGRTPDRVGREIDVVRGREVRYRGALLGGGGGGPPADRHHREQGCYDTLHGFGRGKGGATRTPHSVKAAP